MSEHLSAELLERYGQRRLEPAELLAMDGHLATCAACRERLREMKPRRAALLALQANLRTEHQAAIEHLSRRRLLDYAAGRLTSVDRELTEGHLELCASCAGQAEELRVSRRTLWAKLVAALGLSGPRALPSMIQVAGAIVLVSSLAIALTMWMRTYSDKAATATQPSGQPATPSVVLALNDGGDPIILDAQGNFAGLDLLPPADQQRVRTALTTQRVATPKTIQELRQSSSPLMGSAAGTAFALVSPVGRIVADENPILRWRSLNGAIGYRVTITDPATGYQEVAASPELRTTEWTVDRKLPGGRIYAWQVTARTGSAEVKAPAPDAAEARFSLLEQEKANEIARAEKTYPRRHLIMGLIYAEAGLIDESEAEFQALVAANPSSTVAQNLLRDVRAKR